jgi:hypothetical protein
MAMGVRDDNSGFRFSETYSDPTMDPNPILNLDSGNVGIGTNQAYTKLLVYDEGDLLRVSRSGDSALLEIGYNGQGSNSVTTTTATIKFGSAAGDANYDHCVIENREYSAAEARELLLFSGNDGSDRIRLASSGDICFDTFTSATTTRTAENRRMTIERGGAVSMAAYLKIGTGSHDAGAMASLGANLQGRRNLFITSTYGSNASSNYGWWIGAQNATLSSTDNDLYFEVIRNGVSNVAAHIQDNNDNILMNFTGQHRCKLEPTYQESLVGLIVECTGEYYNLDKGISPTINDSIPNVKLTTNENSKAILGVISCEEDDENKRTFGGNFVSIYQNTDGVKRTFINSLGEGGVWVCSSNGNLEIGDTITSSNIAGYGMKQSDDLMHNYTVAKATMNCNFSTIEADSHILKRRPKVNIIVSEYERQITEEVVEEYTEIVKENGKYVKKILSKTYTRDVSEEVDIYDENDKLIGLEVISKVEILQTTKEEVVKDSSGNIIWENITDGQGSPVYEDIYQIRYLKPDGTILNKSQYDAIIASSGQAYKAVFVGCTYHSG